MPLSGAYKSLKHAVKNPSIMYSRVADKPNYMKMTFSMGRQAPAGARFTEMSKTKDDKKKSSIVNNISALSKKHGDKAALNPLLMQLKSGANIGDSSTQKFVDAVFGGAKQKTKKEVDRDKKVEALLLAFQKNDEDIMRKEHLREETKR